MIPLYKPYIPPLPELDSILHSGQLTYGRYCRAFEKKLQDFFDTPWVLTTNSFNTAISVAITTLDLKYGDGVIASPMGCLASIQPYLTAGMKIKWADVDPHTGTLSPDSVRSVIDSNTKCIIHNHFCGYPGDIDSINSIGYEYGIPVIDDGIECFGTTYKGRKIGNCGTSVTVFSLTPVRNPSTVDGGIVIFQNKSDYDKAVLIRDCGIDRTRFRDEYGEINPDCDISYNGYSATMCDTNGYIGLVQMDYIDEILKSARINAESWRRHLDGYQGIAPLSYAQGDPNYWVFGTLADDKLEMMKYFRDNGFWASGVHTDNSVYSAFGTRPELPGTSEFMQHYLALPCGWWADGKI